MARDGPVLLREPLGANAGWEVADAVDLDAVVEDGDGDVRARVAHVAVDDGVDDDLAQRLRRHRQAVLAVDGALREARGQRQRPVEPHDRLADHRERVQVTPHLFRHTAAVHFLESGVEVNVIRGWLGHVSVDTTNRYAELTLRAKAAALRACEPASAASVDGRSNAVWKDDKQLLDWLNAL
ncbi:MAG: tyrosine-type recombinase/integrase [Burkholderiales bacterium]|nr:tyrosine-type recombinase/integrase [Burkholderiales bacterium]